MRVLRIRKYSLQRLMLVQLHQKIAFRGGSAQRRRRARAAGQSGKKLLRGIGAALSGSRRQIGLSQAQYLLHIILRFRIGGNPAVFRHAARACVIGRQRKGGIAVKLPQKLAQIFGAAHNVLLRVKRVGNAKTAGRARHQLHYALRSGGRDRVRVKTGFRLGHRPEQIHRHPIGLRSLFKRRVEVGAFPHGAENIRK